MKRTFVAVSIIFGISLTNSITTTHHDKPESVAITTNQGTTTTENPINSTALIITNVTLTAAERKKRLLPYQNFYFNQAFNRPHQAGVSAQQYKDYEDTRPISKKPQSVRQKDIIYLQSQKFTPFLESNALPGPFRPMVLSNSNNPQKIQYTYLNPPPAQEEKFIPAKDQLHPDFSAIYDQLSQLKLRQHELRNKTPYGYRLVPHSRFRERPQKVQEYRPSFFDSPTRYKINPSKTTIETFTATNIDIPDPTEEEKYEFHPQRYHQIPTPTNEQFSVPVQTSYKEKPFIRHQIAIEVPQSSLPLTFSPSLISVRKPSNGKERPRKPYIFIQQGKPDAKQPVFILRKPKPSVLVDENFVAEKYISSVPSKSHHYQPRPVYTPEEPQYSPAPVYEDNYEPQYQVTPVTIRYNLQEVQPDGTPSSYNPLKYGTKLNPEPQKVEFKPIVVAPSTSNYEDGNDYYEYQTVTPAAASSMTSIPDQSSIKINQKLVPQYQEVPKIVGEVYNPSSNLGTAGGNSNSLSEILRQLQESNTLPQTLTPDNIDNSIKTLVKILNALRDRQKQQKPSVVQSQYEYDNEAGVDLEVDVFDTPDGGTPGKPGVDYPALSTIPKTSFNCKTQRYKGFFGDPDTNCQVWHYCDLNGGQASFLCPNGTIFSQVALTCDWWYNVKCSSTAQLYVLNERLYKFIIPLSPKFPEDYSGPLVDKYLALKFQEMEEKLRKQKKGKGNKDSKDGEEDSESSESEESEEEESDPSKEESETVQDTERPMAEETAEATTIAAKY